MESKVVLIDTSILIDLFRKTDKSNSELVGLMNKGYTYCISAVTEYEIYTGATAGQLYFWNAFFAQTAVLPFNKSVAQAAVSINRELRKSRKQIGIADLFIAATAVSNGLPLATLNRKHFDRINGLAALS